MGIALADEYGTGAADGGRAVQARGSTGTTLQEHALSRGAADVNRPLAATVAECDQAAAVAAGRLAQQAVTGTVGEDSPAGHRAAHPEMVAAASVTVPVLTPLMIRPPLAAAAAFGKAVRPARAVLQVEIRQLDLDRAGHHVRGTLEQERTRFGSAGESRVGRMEFINTRKIGRRNLLKSA